MSLPQPGNVVRARRRHWLVSEVIPGERADDATLVRLRCLDDDAAGEPLDVFWQVELGTKVFRDEEQLRFGERLDDPRTFGAWLLALQWACVTATDKELFQAPFRAGIEIKPYQLEPLRKALDLPRVNLFIADDVGLGKTIEAGLVLQELVLRQRVDRVLVVCPPSVTLQWKEELEQRFGLGFAVYDREWIAARRRERGWGVNPWLTHPRFIVSYNMLRGTDRTRGQDLELLIAALGPRARKSILILDEVHQVAPASGSVYATDTRTTHAIRQIANRFEHRLFLSATPHNGHSNSFSTLLELLDAQRFVRGVRVKGAAELEPIMVRRLKRDLRDRVGGLPVRKLVDHVIRLGSDAPEIQLGSLLARYEDAYREALVAAGVKDIDARALVCISLHKRLLSSIPAFARTLRVHAETAARLPISPPTLFTRPSEDEGDLTEEQRSRLEDERVALATVNPGEVARALLRQMQDIAEASREVPDARLRELARWIRESCCPDGRWNTRRVVVFTEYDDTLRWIQRHLPTLLRADTDDRIGTYTGGMSEENRERLKEDFNRDPAVHPLRILLCTDAGREGINLQAHCADLFHFDLPWNPSRVEQRNGRIDRTLQPAAEVRCHYFDVPDRPEDRVLTYMVRKIQRIQEELGSLSDVLSERLAQRMELGLRGLEPAEIDRLVTPDAAALEAVAVLESRGREGALTGDLELLSTVLDRSRRSMGWRVDQLQQVVDSALRMVSLDGSGLRSRADRGFADPDDGPVSFTLPPLDESWDPILEPMREEQVQSGRARRLRPVTFAANDRMDAPAVQLHLAHPLVRRLLQRFVAPGWSSHELNRVTVLSGEDRLRRVIAFARLVLFGVGAARLHEEIIEVAGQVTSEGELVPLAETGTATTLRVLADKLASGASLHPDLSRQRECKARAPADFASLRPLLDARRVLSEGRARGALTRRAEEEATAMAEILTRQELGIRRAKEDARQQALQFNRAARDEREQFERDVAFMDERLKELAKERIAEPEAVRRSYDITLVRFEPMGIIYLWPVG